jgi:hypothetical protein
MTGLNMIKIKKFCNEMISISNISFFIQRAKYRSLVQQRTDHSKQQVQKVEINFSCVRYHFERKNLN